jgi:hypothetical protein
MTKDKPTPPDGPSPVEKELHTLADMKKKLLEVFVTVADDTRKFTETTAVAQAYALLTQAQVAVVNSTLQHGADITYTNYDGLPSKARTDALNKAFGIK